MIEDAICYLSMKLNCLDQHTFGNEKKPVLNAAVLYGETAGERRLLTGANLQAGYIWFMLAKKAKWKQGSPMRKMLKWCTDT